MPTIEQARAWYTDSDPVHGFDHVLRVLALAERLAQAEGADPEIVRTAALLHDAVPPDGPGGEGRRDHHQVSAEFAAQVLSEEGWQPERIVAVQHAIYAHRFRDERALPETIEARVLFDADKLDAIGAIGIARAVAYAVRRGSPAYAPPSKSFLEEGRLQPGEPHSAYHEYLFKLIHIKDRLYTSAGRRLAEERHQLMAEFFHRLVDEAGGQTTS